MEVNVDNKTIAVDTSFIEEIDVDAFSEIKTKKAVEQAVAESLKSEGIELDKDRSEHKKVLYDIHFYTLMVLNQMKNEKGE